MENRCYICGAVGFAELLATCMNCKSMFIHVYCMKIIRFDVPHDWICEDCHEPPKQVALKRKVKFIPKGEAIALASQSSLSKGKRHLASPEKACSTVEVPMKKMENLTDTVPLATSVPRCGVHVCSPEKPSGLPTTEQNKCKKNSVHPEPLRKQKMHSRTPSSYSKPFPDLESFKELFIPSHAASTKSRLGFSQGFDPYKGTLKESKNAREQRLSCEKLTVDRYLPNHPSSNATWKGCFKTSIFSAPVSSSVTVWGYPPAKVGKKAYEFSKKMPDVLRFEAISRRTVWANMFNDGGPDKYDIGLYFFPIGDRSEQHYSRLVSQLEKQDIVLKSCIDGIELLIFSSSFLDEKSKEINQACYLWGLFVPPVITFKELDQNKLPSKTNTKPASQHILKNQQAADMEIDMVGGLPVGQTDDPAPTDSVSGSKKIKAVGAPKLPSSWAKVKPEKWDGSPCAAPNIPPGFEEAWRVKYKTIDEILKSKSGR